MMCCMSDQSFSLSLLFRGGERSEHFRVSLLELQKFLLEYQRVSSTEAQGKDEGVPVGIQYSKGSLAMGLG